MYFPQIALSLYNDFKEKTESRCVFLRFSRFYTTILKKKPNPDVFSSDCPEFIQRFYRKSRIPMYFPCFPDY